jgi:glycine cleavage system H lipoate-binding protein|tara:strand:- start:11412 stop:11927 length:516 start_codon:yes stop_codon:yes gene_type:complete
MPGGAGEQTRPGSGNVSSRDGKSSREDVVVFRVGLADRAFDLIGDVKGMDKAVKVHTTIAKHENLLVLRWEGFKRTASDELYHAVWANTEGVRNFRLPFQSEVVKFNKNALADPYKTVGPSEKGWIAEISVDRHVLELALKNGDVMEEGSYREMCDAEEDEEDAAASRSYP